MDTQYYIQLTLKTANGTEGFAKFLLGDDRKKDYAIVRRLRGITEVNEKQVMYLDFMEVKSGLPLSVDMITCTLEQLGANCKIITKELFKMNALSFSSA